MSQILHNASTTISGGIFPPHATVGMTIEEDEKGLFATVFATPANGNVQTVRVELPAEFQQVVRESQENPWND